MFRQAFQSQDLSYGSTIAFALFFLAFMLAIIFLTATNRRSQQTA
jgi:ABC-type sugar transport system permease subunit